MPDARLARALRLEHVGLERLVLLVQRVLGRVRVGAQLGDLVDERVRDLGLPVNVRVERLRQRRLQRDQRGLALVHLVLHGAHRVVAALREQLCDLVAPPQLLLVRGQALRGLGAQHLLERRQLRARASLALVNVGLRGARRKQRGSTTSI